MDIHVEYCINMSYSTVNVKPDYLEKLNEIHNKTKLSKTAILEFLIDAEHKKVMLEK